MIYFLLSYFDSSSGNYMYSAIAEFEVDGKTYLAVAAADGALSITELQLAGKKKMAVKDFLIGFRDPQAYTTSQGTSSQITGKKA